VISKDWGDPQERSCEQIKHSPARQAHIREAERRNRRAPSTRSGRSLAHC
jgi:hypothetical protein